MIDFYKPKYFTLQELVHPDLYAKYDAETLWSRFNPRALWTADALRKEYGHTVCNDWKWGGKYVNRGLRIPGDDKFALLTAHNGNALDLIFKNHTAQRVRDDLFYSMEHNTPPKECFQYITEVETGDNMGWFHFAVTNRDRSNGIFVFERQ